jgi:cell division transport system permease protein
MSETARKSDGASAPPGEPAGRRPRAPIRIRPMGPIVPAASVSAHALIFVISIMAFLACLTLGAVTMIRSTANNWQGEISREATVQIKPMPGLDMDEALVAAREAVISIPGVRRADIIDRAATQRLLEPWLGSDFDMDTLPVPRLIVVTIDETGPPDFEAMRSTLRAAVPHASLDDHRTWVDRLVAMARTTVVIGLGVLILVFTATVLTVIFATRGALSGNRHIVEVLHFVGAEGHFVAGQFQRHFLMIGIKGAVAGGVLAAIVFALAHVWSGYAMATPQNDQMTALFGTFRIDALGYLGIVAVIGAIGALTALTTRITVIHTIREIDRIRSDTSRTE